MGFLDDLFGKRKRPGQDAPAARTAPSVPADQKTVAPSQVPAAEQSGEVRQLLADLSNCKADARAAIAAANALGVTKDKSAVDPLRAVLWDNEVHCEVRSAALDSLVQTLGSAASPDVMKALGDGHWHVRWTGARHAGELEIADAIPALIELLKDKEGMPRGRAAQALGNLAVKNAGDLRLQAAVPLLVGLLKDEESFTRLYAAETLGEIDDGGSLGYLATARRDETLGAVQKAMETAIKTIGSRRQTSHPGA